MWDVWCDSVTDLAAGDVPGAAAADAASAANTAVSAEPAHTLHVTTAELPPASTLPNGAFVSLRNRRASVSMTAKERAALEADKVGVVGGWGGGPF